MRTAVLITLLLSVVSSAAFVIDNKQHKTVGQSLYSTSSSETSTSKPQKNKLNRAPSLVQTLVAEEQCFATPAGAQQFYEACAANVLIEDRFFGQPFTGKTDALKYAQMRVDQRQNKGTVRIDRITDGDLSCGYCWTWVSNDNTVEGLRGTSFVQLDEQTGEIAYFTEIAEPLYKPGDLTLDLLKAVTKGATPKQYIDLQEQNPIKAPDVAKYLYEHLAIVKPEQSVDEMCSFFEETNILYRDFNFEKPMTSVAQVRQFTQDFSFDGLEFRPTRYDDGVDSTCFTWEVVLEGAEDQTIKGMSFYELDPETRKITYVRDVPESAIKPPPLGAMARNLRPGIGVFNGVPVGSRPGGK